MRLEWATLCEKFEDTKDGIHVRRINYDGVLLGVDEPPSPTETFSFLAVISVNSDELPSKDEHELVHRWTDPEGQEFKGSYWFRAKGSNPFATPDRPGRMTIGHEDSFPTGQIGNYWFELSLDGDNPIRLPYYVRRLPTP